MTTKHSPVQARVGDALEVRGIHGESARHGEIMEILGEPGRERYRVRWDDRHESIIVPADGVRIIGERGARSK